jgi:hypothetical protein
MSGGFYLRKYLFQRETYAIFNNFDKLFYLGNTIQCQPVMDNANNPAHKEFQIVNPLIFVFNKIGNGRIKNGVVHFLVGALRLKKLRLFVD